MNKKSTINPKKVAQLMAKEEKLIIYRKEEFEYWVTDTYIAAKFYTDDFQDFMYKYSNYKATANIPINIQIGDTIASFNKDQFKDHDCHLEGILDDKEVNINLNLTDFYYKNDEGQNIRVCITENKKLTGFNDKYNTLIPNNDNKYIIVKGPLSPVYIYEDNQRSKKDIRALIMPMRLKEGFSESYSSIIKAQIA